jgi:hypothetical protein
LDYRGGQNNAMIELIKIVAKIELFSGKNMLKQPVFNNYRPAFYFEGAKTKISGKINLIDADCFFSVVGSVL